MEYKELVTQHSAGDTRTHHHRSNLYTLQYLYVIDIYLIYNPLLYIKYIIMKELRTFLLGTIIGGSIVWFAHQMLSCHSYKKDVAGMHEYQMDVNWDSITIYDGAKTIGTVKMEGQLDSLIINDNL